MRYLLLVCFIFFLQNSKAQSFELIRSADNADSSFYDIFRFGHSRYWLGGEHGVLYAMNAEGELKAIHYPSLGLDILKIDTLSDGQLVLAAEKGTLYFYNRKKETWRIKRVKGYEDKVFYEMTRGANGELYVCGGNSKIAQSRARLPKGFILRSVDGGNTWEKIYSNPLAMVWDVDFVEGKLLAVIYNPLSRKRLISLNQNGHWHTILRNWGLLIHQYNEEDALLAGTRQIPFNPQALHGRVGGPWQSISEARICWSTKRSGPLLLSLASAGFLEIDNGNGRKLFKVSNFNLYESARSPDGGFFIVGSHGLILHMWPGRGNMMVNKEYLERKLKHLNLN